MSSAAECALTEASDGLAGAFRSPRFEKALDFDAPLQQNARFHSKVLKSFGFMEGQATEEVRI